MNKKKVYIVFPAYDEKVHLTKDPGIILTHLKEKYDVQMVNLAKGISSADCLELPESELYSADWLDNSPGAIILYHFQAKYETIIKKAKEIGYRVIIKGDTDGVRRPRNPFHPHFPYHVHAKSSPAFGYVFKYWFRDWKKWARQRHLYDVDYVIVESSMAQKLFIKAFPDLWQKFVMIPDGAYFSEPPALEKENSIIAVGRWDDVQKYPELLIDTLKQVLAVCPEWKAEIIGPYDQKLIDVFNRLPEGTRTRVNLRGSVEKEQVLKYMEKSKVLLSTSRWESFGLVAAEALSKGGSIVCTPTGMGMQTADGLLGTKAEGWSLEEITQALFAEINMWETEMRDSRNIFDIAANFYDWSAIVEKIERLFKI